MSGKTVTLTTAAVAVVVTLAVTLFVPLTAASPVESLSFNLEPRAQLPQELLSTGITGPAEARQRQEHHRLSKRSYVGGSCKGLYSRSAWNTLYRVCNDCQNLYRTPGIGKDCRKGCFESNTFKMCLENLLLPVDHYLNIATSLRGS